MSDWRSGPEPGPYPAPGAGGPGWGPAPAGQGYPGQGYPGQGYPGQGYPGQGYQDPGYQGYGAVGPPGYEYGYNPTGGWARAGFFPRLIALMIDGLVASAALIALSIPLVAVGVVGTTFEVGTCTDFDTGLQRSCDVPSGGTVALWILLGLVWFLLYLLILFFVLIRPLATTGQTVGRRVMDIKVVDRITGGNISLGRSFGRYLFANFISGSFCYIGYLWMLWDEDAQTLHDKVVNSIVVEV